MSRLVAAVILTASLAAAQTSNATLNGQVSDISGAVIPNATIIVRNEGTNVSRTTQSNADGPVFSTGPHSGNLLA